MWPDWGINVDQDFENMLKSLGKVVQIQEKPKVDKKVEMKNAEVLVEEDGDDKGLVYDILMIKTDVKYGRVGMNNFYVMQVVYDRVKDLYILFNRWGRVGSSGQFQHTPFRSRDEATKEFKKLFRTKTGNIFSLNMKFEKKTKNMAFS